MFNIAISNTDDHARNHAAFWDGRHLALTPAYDLCPQLRGGTEANQAMDISRSGRRSSTFATCVVAAEDYGLTAREARGIIDHQVTTILQVWQEAAEMAQLTRVDRDALLARQILNPYAFSD